MTSNVMDTSLTYPTVPHAPGEPVIVVIART